MAKVLLKTKLDQVLADWRTAGFEVWGPVATAAGRDSSFGPVARAAEMDLAMVLPRASVKGLFLPRTERVLTYATGKQRADVETVAPPDAQRVIFGVRPCDAASLVILDPLFNWDYRDEYWNRRREHTTVVVVACTEKDAFCMCTSLGFAPDSPKGADVLLRPLADGSGWQVETLSPKGEALVAGSAAGLGEVGEPALARLADVPRKFDLDRAARWLAQADHFDDALWTRISPRCIGCGACTYVCPTCHCFDIQDEGDVRGGVRRKNWDSCSFALFTLHTSGHNPRPRQSARWRQRIMHKFNYYPGKFNYPGCSGCGRCTRHCPVDMGVTETLQTLGPMD